MYIAVTINNSGFVPVMHNYAMPVTSNFFPNHTNLLKCIFSLSLLAMSVTHFPWLELICVNDLVCVISDSPMIIKQVYQRWACWGVAEGGVKIPLYESKSDIWESVAYWATTIIFRDSHNNYINNLALKTMPAGLRSHNPGVTLHINWVVTS